MDERPACLLGIHATLPGGHNDVVKFRRVEAGCVKAQVEVHEAGVQRRVLLKNKCSVRCVSAKLRMCLAAHTETHVPILTTMRYANQSRSQCH